MTTSLKISKELWERGVRIDTHWIWINVSGEWEVVENEPPNNHVMYWYPAYLLHELLEILCRQRWQDNIICISILN